MDLTGRYELDRERSDSLYNHMKTLGCDEIAALASEKLHITIDIVQTKDELSIWQASQLGDSKRVLYLEPGRETTESDSRKATVSFGPKTITIETTFARGKLVDTRHFEQDGAVLAQLLELTVKEAPQNVIRTRRYLKKIGPPDPAVTAT